MQATLALREKMAQLLAADATTLAPAADANVIALVIAPFTPTEALVFADLTLADFDGSTPLAVGLGTQAEGLDPLSGDAIISLKDPVGGWRWETTGVTNLPQTVWGYALLNDGLDTVFAAERLITPIPLTAVNQVIQLGGLTLRQLAGSLT
jgi:hypothetical protein